MKKLIYDKNTKEISIIEKQETENIKKKSTKVKLWLESNKICFEIFSYVFVGIMGIIISFAGWKTNERSANIYKRQLEILENDREPHFTISNKIIFKKQKDEGYYKQICYTIKNDGGVINDGFLGKIYTNLLISIPMHDKLYKCYIIGLFSKSDGRYIFDKESKEFSFYGVESSANNKFVNNLQLELNKIFKRDDVVIFLRNYIEINYINYKNEKYNKTYEFTENKIVLNKNDNSKMSLGVIEFGEDVTTIASKIYNKINTMQNN